MIYVYKIKYFNAIEVEKIVCIDTYILWRGRRVKVLINNYKVAGYRRNQQIQKSNVQYKNYRDQSDYIAAVGYLPLPCKWPTRVIKSNI